MSVSPEMIARISELRAKALAGTLTLEETKEGIKFLRAERMMMPPAKAKTKSVQINGEDLLKDFMS